MIALYQDNNLKLCTFPNMEILAELSNIGYGNISILGNVQSFRLLSWYKAIILLLCESCISKQPCWCLIGYGNISFTPDDKEILIASTIKGLIYKLEKCS